MFENQAKVSAYTKRITFVPWSFKTKKQFLTFRRRSPLITNTQCENYVLKEFDKEHIQSEFLTHHQVEVRILNIDWLLASEMNFLHFSSLLEQSHNQRIFQTDFL